MDNNTNIQISILYLSKSGHTKAIAEQIAAGCNLVDKITTKVMNIQDCDESFIKESSCVIIGTPTYYTAMAAEMKQWLDNECGKYHLAGKLGGAFATADFTYGGAELAIQGILTHLMFRGMMIYSGGNSYGNPPIHLGPVSISTEEPTSIVAAQNTYTLYGKRMAMQACKLFQ